MADPMTDTATDTPLRIVSLLPSATEIVFALGLGDQLHGRSFECDSPVDAARVPIVSGTALTTTSDSTPAEIDAQVSSMVADGASIYTLDDNAIRSINPDLILAQDLCSVCAVPSGHVNEALDVIGCTATVVSLDPFRLDDVIACIGTVGHAAGVGERADALMAALRARIDAVQTSIAGRPRPKVLLLEWGDPPFNGGHWMPDMVEAAGGESVLGSGGDRSVRLEWDTIAATEIDVVVYVPCGFGLAGAID
ncbi:MAG: ABC transporter substrate-binding protein [Actinobacteria bacterium]|nr:ABC transporter substrate-binding protein [Actinomycetota bacterium]